MDLSLVLTQRRQVRGLADWWLIKRLRWFNIRAEEWLVWWLVE